MSDARRTRSARFCRATLVVFLAHSAGCVSRGVGEEMQRDIAELQRNMQAAQRGLDEQRAVLDSKIAEAEQRIAKVDETLNVLNRAARSTDADFGVQLERLVRESQELRGMLELSDYRVQQLETKLEGEGSLTERVSQIDSESGRADLPSTLPTEVPTEPRKMLDYGRGLAEQGKINEARGVYRQVLRKAPKKPGIADLAYLRLGNLYYNEKKYRSAVQEYVKVAEQFERGDYADDAYFKLGQCMVDLGNLKDAKIFFGAVVKSYKKSPLVPQARKMLREVSQRSKSEP